MEEGYNGNSGRNWLAIVLISNGRRDENARAYLQKFEKFYGPLEEVPSVLLQKILFGLPLFPNLPLQQLHEVFVSAHV